MFFVMFRDVKICERTEEKEKSEQENVFIEEWSVYVDNSRFLLLQFIHVIACVHDITVEVFFIRFSAL